MATGPMQFGADNNAGATLPNRTTLRAQNSTEPTLVVRNESAGPLQPPGNGLDVQGGPIGVSARADFSTDGVGVRGEAGTGVEGISQTARPGVSGRSASTGDGVRGVSPRRNGVQGESSSQFASGVYGENLSRGGWGVAGRSNAPVSYSTAPGWGAAVWGHNTVEPSRTQPVGGWAGFFTGNVRVTGIIVKPGTAFSIDNPAAPATSILNHFGVESDNWMNIYNGNVTTDAEGNATVELPGYFEALNRDLRYQLTVHGQFAQAIVAEEVKDNSFSIKTDKPNVRVSWQVTGIRQDAWANTHRIEVEVEKSEGERGKYFHPREHGQPATAGIYHVESPISEEAEVDRGQAQGE